MLKDKQTVYVIFLRLLTISFYSGSRKKCPTIQHRIEFSIDGELQGQYNRGDMRDIRIAAVVTCAPAGEIRGNFNRMAYWTGRAKSEGAAIVCFPELNITGYITSPDVLEYAEPVPGPSSQQIVDLAEKEQITILAGIAEKNTRGRVFATHLVAEPGEKIKKYRKLHIAPPEAAVYTPGKSILLFEVSGIKFGIQLCYDSHFPELATRMALKGADLIFMPHASPRGTCKEKFTSWMRHLPARAFDNSVFVVACNQACENRKQMQFPGIAVVIGPSGEIIKKGLSGREGLLTAELKAETLEKVREHRMRYFLPRRRADLFDR